MVDNCIDRAFSKQARSILRQLVDAEHHPACSARGLQCGRYLGRAD